MPSSDTQFKPGQSGNPKGRPKKAFCIPDILRKISNEEGAGQASKLETIMRVVYRKAAEGDLQACSFIADRMEGKARQFIDMSTTNIEADPFDGLTTEELREYIERQEG